MKRNELPPRAGRNVRFRQLARLMRALGNESRLTIVDRLSHGACCVCELAEFTGLDQSTVSRHMSTLEGSGLVSRERRGQHVYFRLSAPWVKELLDAHSTTACDTGEATANEV
ncbi:MAG: winged helix-turn-helix transcriptional regulator [Candidatus Eisenbacteria bacterium]|nr:winged helix-turn-helix transcriptional regulator [Candidatus Eisenbacteria bacterium]